MWWPHAPRPPHRSAPRKPPQAIGPPPTAPLLRRAATAVAAPPRARAAQAQLPCKTARALSLHACHCLAWLGMAWHGLALLATVQERKIGCRQALRASKGLWTWPAWCQRRPRRRPPGHHPHPRAVWCTPPCGSPSSGTRQAHMRPSGSAGRPQVWLHREGAQSL